MNYKSAKNQFLSDMDSEGMDAIIAEDILSLANKLHRYAVNNCNRIMTEVEQCKDAANRHKIKKLMPHGFAVDCGGDPRGYVVRITTPNNLRNGFGDGYGVPTRVMFRRM